MATVYELSEPYLNYLVRILPAGRGVCAICWTAIEPQYPYCFPCMTATRDFGCPQLANVVVPIALAVKREQLAHELWHYKYDSDARVRETLTIRLAAVLWRFLGVHEAHVATAITIPQFDVVTTVPGTKAREDEHPLIRIVGTLVGQTRDRYRPLLTGGPSATVEGRAVLRDRYQPTNQAAQVLADHPNVLLIDDTWTTGGRAQSAILALRAGGAAKVGVVVIGRHFDRNYGAGESYYQQAKARRFSWDLCCLDERADST